MRAFRIHNEQDQVGGRLEDIDRPACEEGGVLIRVSHSSINYKDALAATGTAPIIREFPRIGGIDLAGEIAASRDDRFREGDAVLVTGYGLGESRDGGYAEYAAVPGDLVVPRPAGLDAATAMALGTAGFTAALAVQRLQQVDIEPARGKVLVTGASGGVGSLAIDMLAGLGYEVAALTGKAGDAGAVGFLQEIGAGEIVDRTALELDGKRPLEKGLWAAAVDGVGGDVLGWLTRTVNPWGAIASYGLAGGVAFQATVMPFIVRGIALLGVDSVQCPMAIRAPLWERLAGDLAPRHLPRIARTVSLDTLPQCFDDFLQGSVQGRTVVEIGS